MGTELRFLKQMQVEGFEESIDSEFWHGKALELAIKFLPGDAPLVKHIVSSYQKHHSPSYEQIPEDEEVDSNVRVIRPSEGITYNKIAPVIRDIPKPSVKLAPLDLPLNDYMEKPKSKKTLEAKSTITEYEVLKDSKISAGAKSDQIETEKTKAKLDTPEEGKSTTKANKQPKKEITAQTTPKEPMQITTEDTVTQTKLT